MEVQGAHYDNNGKAEQQELSVHQKKYGLFSTGNLLVDYALESDSGLKYGFNLGIEQTTRNNRGTPLSIYIESSYGRIEAGSGQTAAQKMRITGYTASCAAGGGWDMASALCSGAGSSDKVVDGCAAVLFSGNRASNTCFKKTAARKSETFNVVCKNNKLLPEN